MSTTGFNSKPSLGSQQFEFKPFVLLINIKKIYKVEYLKQHAINKIFLKDFSTYSFVILHLAALLITKNTWL